MMYWPSLLLINDVLTIFVTNRTLSCLSRFVNFTSTFSKTTFWSLFRGEVTSPNNNESAIIGGEAITWIENKWVIYKLSGNFKTPYHYFTINKREIYMCTSDNHVPQLSRQVFGEKIRASVLIFSMVMCIHTWGW
jgi:hypothetical protein